MAHNICWHNATPHEITVLTRDDEGDVEGFLMHQLVRFSVTKKIPPSGEVARLVANHPAAPQGKVVEGVLLKEYQPWNDLHLNLTRLPGKTWKHQQGFEPTDVVYLIVSLPVAEYVSNSKLKMPPPIQRVTPTILVCPNTSPDGCVRDSNGTIIGVTDFKAFGDFCYRE